MLKIAQVMNEQGRKRTWLASGLGVSPGHVTRLLDGRRTWSATQQARAVALLDWPEERAAELFEGLMECPVCQGLGVVPEEGSVAVCGDCDGDGEVTG